MRYARIGRVSINGFKQIRSHLAVIEFHGEQDDMNRMCYNIDHLVLNEVETR